MIGRGLERSLACAGSGSLLGELEALIQTLDPVATLSQDGGAQLQALLSGAAGGHLPPVSVVQVMQQNSDGPLPGLSFNQDGELVFVTPAPATGSLLIPWRATCRRCYNLLYPDPIEV